MVSPSSQLLDLLDGLFKGGEYGGRIRLRGGFLPRGQILNSSIERAGYPRGRRDIGEAVVENLLL